MSQPESAGNCERCQQILYGHLGVFEGELYGVVVVAIRETSPRNWICCDACSVMLCHACCTHPQSGYCDQCFDAITSEEQGMRQRRENHESVLGATPARQAGFDEH